MVLFNPRSLVSLWVLSMEDSYASDHTQPFNNQMRNITVLNSNHTVQVQDLPPAYTYTSFDGNTYTLYPYKGTHVALLVPSAYYDEAILERIVNAIDLAYAYYAQATGREPSLFYNFEGLATIAAVPATCGAGCAYLGFTGIELLTEYFDILFQDVLQHNQFDQVVFYELGRNFWFYGDQIEYAGDDNTGSITTGFAVFMRYMSMEAAGVVGSSHGVDFEFGKAEVKGLLNRYLADSSLSWSNTLRIGQAPANPLNLQATDFFASFLFELRARYGDQFLLRVWQEVGERPMRQTTQGALDNFIAAASIAAGEDLTYLFAIDWRWPVSPTLYDAIFFDDFEPGDLYRWSEKKTDSDNLRVVRYTGLFGGNALEAVIDDNTAIYVTDDSPNIETRYRARFYFDPNSIMMKNNNAHYIFNGYQGTSSVMFRVEFRFNKKYEIRVALVNDKAVWKNSKWIAISDAVHFFELDWSAATAVGANNGYLKLWVDGVLKQNLTKVDNDTRRLDRINLGAVEAIDKGTRGNYFFDEFVSRRRTYIGPVIADASNDTEQTLNDIDTSASLSFDLEGLSIEAIPTSNIIDTSSAILITSTNQYTPPSGYQLYGKVFDIQALSAIPSPIGHEK